MTKRQYVSDVLELCNQYESYNKRKDEIQNDIKRIKHETHLHVVKLNDEHFSITQDAFLVLGQINEQLIVTEMKKMFPTLNVAGVQRYQYKDMYISYHSGARIFSTEYTSANYGQSHKFMDDNNDLILLADKYWNVDYKWYLRRIIEIDALYLVLAKFREPECDFRIFPREIMLMILKLVKREYQMRDWKELKLN